MATKIMKPKKNSTDLHRTVYELLKQYYQIMLYWEKNKDLVMLIDYHKYDNPVKEAERLYLGKFKSIKLRECGKPNTYYITEQI